jgi:paraquat-inducible protein B
MRKRIDPRVIGSFVIGAIILIVAGLIFFGPGGLLSETKKYVVYFEGSVKGLNVGSPVRFRGVKVGQVSDINVRVKPSNFEFHIPVVIEILPSRIRAEGSQEGIFEALKTTFKDQDPMLSLVEKGLRVQLQLDSLVTGQLYVNMDMMPDKPSQLTGHSYEYPELPSVNSSFEELARTVEDIPLKELANKMIKSAEGFEQLINSKELHLSIMRLDETTQQLNAFLTTLNRNVEPLTKNFQQTMQQTQQTMQSLNNKLAPLIDETRETVAHLNSKLDPAANQFNESLKSLDTAAKTATSTMQQVQTVTSEESIKMQQLSLTLEELYKTARSLRLFTKELEQDPQILIRGHLKGGSE